MAIAHVCDFRVSEKYFFSVVLEECTSEYGKAAVLFPFGLLWLVGNLATRLEQDAVPAPGSWVLDNKIN